MFCLLRINNNINKNASQKLYLKEKGSYYMYLCLNANIGIYAFSDCLRETQSDHDAVSQYWERIQWSIEQNIVSLIQK